jgi:proteasome lid subunit RPN8/RPN11
MHDQDPVGYPRDSRTAYLLDPEALLRVLKELELRGGRLIGFYHSHVDGQTYFSAEDERGALSLGFEPGYPDAVHLVLSVCGEEAGQARRQVTGYRGFRWDPEARQFAEIPLEVGE